MQITHLNSSPTEARIHTSGQNTRSRPNRETNQWTKTSHSSNWNKHCNNAKKTSPGQDTILKEIPNCELEMMLRIFKIIWAKGKLPGEWKEALITPILKLTKPNNDPSSYRPISLTSSICKIMERLTANRLCWYIERNRLFNKNQSGFRRNHACIDQIWGTRMTCIKPFTPKIMS